MKKLLKLVSLLVIGLPSISLSTVGCTSNCNCNSNDKVNEYFNIAPDLPTFMGFDNSNNLYTAVENSGIIYKITPDKKQITHHGFEDQVLTYMLVKNDGTIYCATAGKIGPQKIFKVDPQGQSTEIAALPSGQNPVISFVFDAQGILYCINGSAIVYKVSDGNVIPFCTIENQKLTSLAINSKDTLYAGSDSPRFYKVSADGQSTTPFDIDPDSVLKLAFDNADNLFVLSKNRNIYIFSSDGNHDDEVVLPSGVASRDIIFDSNNNAYLTTDSLRIFKISIKLPYDWKLSQLLHLTDSVGRFLAWDKNKNLYCSSDNGIIYKFLVL